MYSVKARVLAAALLDAADQVGPSIPNAWPSKSDSAYHVSIVDHTSHEDGQYGWLVQLDEVDALNAMQARDLAAKLIEAADAVDSLGALGPT